MQGGRVACELAAALPDLAAACLLLSYPLHPPGKPQQLRDTPLAGLALPLMLVRGTRDAFSTSEQWEQLLLRLQSPSWHVHTVEGGDHGLKLPAGSGGQAASQAVLADACAAVTAFLRELTAGVQGNGGGQQQRREQQGGGGGALAGKSRKQGSGRAPAGKGRNGGGGASGGKRSKERGGTEQRVTRQRLPAHPAP